MKQWKKGFTLAELLLAMAIIGVVTAIGMLITKENITKTYNLFYYTGYVNLLDAIIEAKIEGKSLKTEVNTLLGTTENLVDGNKVVASNGIVYTFEDSNTIAMSVPTPKKKGETDANYTVAFYYNDYGNYLIPLEPNTTTHLGPNLQERKDLLFAFIDDGIVGRNNVVNRTNWKDKTNWRYKAPIYASYKDVYCSINNEGVLGVIDCTNFTNVRINKQVGVLKVANPRRAH